jgi:DNA ligase-associated metallophosphoesterase
LSQLSLAAEITETPILRFSGQNFEPLPSGGLYWHAQNTLLVADLHLHKMASFAVRGQMLPPYDTAMTLSRLEKDLARTGAQQLVSIGDSFHRANASNALADSDKLRLARITEKVNCIWLTGNHDPAPHNIGGESRSELTLAGLTLAHEPQRGARGLVAGHLHPAAEILMGGRTTRRPCFVHDNRLMVLPAYGASTGSINILGPAFAGLFHWPALEVIMIGKDRTYPVSPRRLIG